MTNLPLWHHAARLAARAHQGQLRKDDRTPYFAHPARVAMIAATHFGVTDEKILAAAYLHDVIEDTTVDYDDLLEQFGKEVADMVAALSKDHRMIEPERERAFHAQLAAASWPVRLIKLADVCDNFSDIDDEADLEHWREKLDDAIRMSESDPELADAVAFARQYRERATSTTH